MNQAAHSCVVGILVADDEPGWLKNYDELLRAYGFSCRVAATSREAIIILNGGGISHFLCDGTGWDDAIRLGITLGCRTVIQTGSPELFRKYGVPVVDKLGGPTAALGELLAGAGDPGPR